MEELRLQLFLFFLNYWRLYKNMGVDMGDITRAICESMPDIPVCALEGCDTLLFGYMPYAIYCSDYCRYKARHETPQRKVYNKDYFQRPKNKAYQKVYGKAWREANPEYYKDYMRSYRARKKAERLAAEE